MSEDHLKGHADSPEKRPPFVFTPPSYPRGHGGSSQGGQVSMNSGNEQITSMLIRLSNIEHQLDMFKTMPRTGSTAWDEASMRSILSPPLQAEPKTFGDPYAFGQNKTTPIYNEQLQQMNTDLMESLSLRRNLATPEHPPFGMWWTYTIEETLLWPIFEYQGGANSSIDAVLDDSDGEEDYAGTEHVNSDAARRRPYSRKGLDDGYTVRKLTESFLRNVHTKNPILDPNQLRARAAGLVENGLGWDGETCQVLLACALGAISNPWNVSQLYDYDQNHPSAEDYATAREYFIASQKRLGMLYAQSSLIGAQCIFMTGTFLMYTHKPVAGWRMLNSASIACRAYISKRVARETRGSHIVGSRSMEQRLCWSSFKAEREVACEFGMDTSGINVIAYSTSLPTPPNGYASAMNLPPPAEAASPEFPAHFHFPREPYEEQSWYFFLTEIMLRKLEMRIDIFFQNKRREAYRRAGDSPELFFRSLLEALQEFGYQLTRYYESLPPVMQFPLDDPSPCGDELRQHLRWRLLSVRHDICLPALYILLHNDVSRWHGAFVDDLVDLANTCLRLDVIFLKTVVTMHRHQNTWLELRKGVRSALILVAARKLKAQRRPGFDKLQVPDDETCREGASTLIRGLKYWAAESRDCTVNLDMLRNLHADFRQ